MSSAVNPEPKVSLGDRVRDTVNGFVGIVTGRAEYLYGCVQVLVSPTVLDKDGKQLDSAWIDEGRVDVIEAGAIAVPATAAAREGGPRADAPKGRR